MKTLFICFCLSFATSTTFAQQKPKKQLVFNNSKKTYLLEASCGTCMFKMEGNGCTLAVKYKDSCYYVKGTNIDDHGDAHDTNGFCNAIQKAKVQGALKNGKFEVTYFELLKP